MELRVLRYFLTVASEGNISRAADMLHVTQPTLSRQIMDLEEELGTKLFIRGKREITLTDDGTLFRQRAQEIVELVDKAEHEFAQRTEQIEGNIVLGCVETLGSRVLADFICEFHEKYPKVQFNLYNGYSDDIKERIDRGLLDMGLLVEPVEISRYEYIRLNQKETYGVLMRADSPLAQKESVTIEDLLKVPMMIPGRTTVHNEVLSWFGPEASKLNIVETHTLLSNASLLVERGIGYAVTLDGALAVQNKNLKFVPIWPEKTTESVLVWKKNRMVNAATSLFIQNINMFIRHGR